MTFPNKAGDHPDTDAILRSELEAAELKAYRYDAGFEGGVLLFANSLEEAAALINAKHPDLCNPATIYDFDEFKITKDEMIAFSGETNFFD
jgi:hypothetical protein